MHKLTMLAIFVLLAAVGLNGCVQPQQQGEKSEEKKLTAADVLKALQPAEPPKPAVQKPAAQATPAPVAEVPKVPAPVAETPKAPAPEPKPEPQAKPAELPKPMKELVRNGNFRAWENGIPIGWSVGNCEEVTGGFDAKAISLRPMEDPEEWNLLQQKLAEPIPLGATVQVSAEIRADNPEMAVLKFVWWNKEGAQFERKLQTVAGEFQTVEIDIDLPDGEGGVAAVQVLRKPNAEGELLVKSVSVKIPE